ncbi:MAG: hypothetical protein DRQ49_12550 [Gammaproteobacteria bacterium]|nr:MAG: hypothetical protein DRQ41_13255 [Gammaproteobacteria bacterium]RKZ39086.1 MAG: hypothetical protein DRQ49_12550 [Gammaproteobacteria bacterium]
MPQYNIRRTATTESYEPKQRIVGGVVLFLIMLLIYSSLKLVLGFSSAPTKFEIDAPLDIERIVTVEEQGSPISIAPMTSTTPVQLSQNQYQRLPGGFVFLDLNGKPMEPEVYQEPPQGNPFDTNEEKWYVQAASFRDQEKAQIFVQKIKDKNIASQAYIIPSKNGWYGIRLPPQSDRDSARQQNQQLRRLLGARGMIKKLN